MGMKVRVEEELKKEQGSEAGGRGDLQCYSAKARRILRTLISRPAFYGSGMKAGA
jgi:hypothetical protein